MVSVRYTIFLRCTITCLIFLISCLQIYTLQAQQVAAHQRADSLGNLGQFEQAITALHEAIAQYEEAEDTTSLFDCQVSVLNHLWRLGRYDEALSHADSLQKAATLIFGAFNVYSGSILANKSTIHVINGRFDSAAYYGRESLRIRENTAEPSNTQLASSFNLLGNIFAQMDQYDSAEYYMLKALAAVKEAFGEDHRFVSIVYNNLGALYQQTNNEKAIEYTSEAIRRYSQQLGPGHPSL